MHVKRIVADLFADNPDEVKKFYKDVLGLDVLMDVGWIVTFGTNELMPVQLNIGLEGGSGTRLPDLSIEVDDLDEVIKRVRSFGVAIEYGPVTEPWGVRRFYVKDPAGNMLNILQHESPIN